MKAGNIRDCRAVDLLELATRGFTEGNESQGGLL